MRQILFPGNKQFWYETLRSPLFDHLTCPKTFLEFTADEGAGAHCQVGAERLALARVYDWLDDTLDASVSPRRHGLVHPDQERQ